MNSEFLKGELIAGIEAELESDAQVRDLPRRIAETSKRNSPISVSDASKIVSMTLATNEKLHEKTVELRKEYLTALCDEVLASRPVSTGPKPQLARARDLGEAMSEAKAIAAKQLRGDN